MNLSIFHLHPAFHILLLALCSRVQWERLGVVKINPDSPVGLFLEITFRG